MAIFNSYVSSPEGNRDLIQGMGLTSPKSAEAWEEDFGPKHVFFCGLLWIGIGDAAWGVDASFFFAVFGLMATRTVLKTDGYPMVIQ